MSVRADAIHLSSHTARTDPFTGGEARLREGTPPCHLASLPWTLTQFLEAAQATFDPKSSVPKYILNNIFY